MRGDRGSRWRLRAARRGSVGQRAGGAFRFDDRPRGAPGIGGAGTAGGRLDRPPRVGALTELANWRFGNLVSWMSKTSPTHQLTNSPTPNTVYRPVDICAVGFIVIFCTRQFSSSPT